MFVKKTKTNLVLISTFKIGLWAKIIVVFLIIKTANINFIFYTLFNSETQESMSIISDKFTFFKICLTSLVLNILFSNFKTNLIFSSTVKPFNN